MPALINPPAIERRLMQHGFKALHAQNRELSLALRREARTLLAELGESPPPNAVILANEIVRSRCLLDTIDALLLKWGENIVNRRRRTLWPLVKQRMDLADSLARRLVEFQNLRVEGEIERRLIAIEERLEGRRGVTYG